MTEKKISQVAHTHASCSSSYQVVGRTHSADLLIFRARYRICSPSTFSLFFLTHHHLSSGVLGPWLVVFSLVPRPPSPLRAFPRNGGKKKGIKKRKFSRPLVDLARHAG